mmetsp:Transcript_18676/g.31121  ORF Transcript_18676/g.31121 Transcript_18676/m.31121 type:complete len:227 (+) Transcript_18676:146-826(+)|eukprot:CAMPEP_0114412342 /NCGR_PEP_ID=MMETSP0103-20121206/275_1 /TAXON_ID=37642 ORGANISM="Paraphysomonas imperforata, Strain PA2" /NCGR_SAMPLE_ID=MMETSP0103 /ASSEMBLY_ACC=CAM_ASM_000201 /LENGTH=226 /DNA_ID=CAMNT_0001580353 /DNA_START=115 /DNA_END=795 /DNA_ORIENTATION=+
MSNDNHVPIAVSSYGDPNCTNDDILVNVYAQPVTTPAASASSYPTVVGYASPPSADPVRAHALPRTLPPIVVDRTSMFQLPDAFQYDERIVRVTAMQRSLKCLTMLDLCLIILMSIFQLQWAFLIWGPVCGYMGVNKLNLVLVYVYVSYWCFRALADAILAVLFGYWWFLISFLIDLYILRYVWQFCVALKAVPPDALTALRNVRNAPAAATMTSTSMNNTTSDAV